MQPRRAGAIWSNEDTALAAMPPPPPPMAATASQKPNAAGASGSTAPQAVAKAPDGAGHLPGSVQHAKKNGGAGTGRVARDQDTGEEHLHSRGLI